MKLLIILSALALTAAVAQDTAAGCIDQVDECPNWAKEGECLRNPVWMRPNCPVSCDLCGKAVKCVDAYKEECPTWKKEGGCTSDNRIWMFFNCPKTCGTCGVKFSG